MSLDTSIALIVFLFPLAFAGSAYVLWLAFSFIRTARSGVSEEPDGVPAQENIGFWSGAVVLLLNPKAYYIIAVMFAQFLHGAGPAELTPVLFITTVFTLNNLIAFIVWTVAGRMLALLFRSQRSKRWLDYLFAAMLAAVAIWMALPLFG